MSERRPLGQLDILGFDLDAFDGDHVADPENVLILALGNPLRGDDGVGTAVLKTLARMPSLPRWTTLLDVGTGDLISVLFGQNCRRVIIVDAVDMGLEPGQWRRFTPEEVRLVTPDPTTSRALHERNLPDTLAFGKALGFKPSEIVIYGVQPLEITYSLDLSMEVKETVPEICSAILDEIRQMGQPSREIMTLVDSPTGSITANRPEGTET